MPPLLLSYHYLVFSSSPSLLSFPPSSTPLPPSHLLPTRCLVFSSYPPTFLSTFSLLLAFLILFPTRNLFSFPLLTLPFLLPLSRFLSLSLFLPFSLHPVVPSPHSLIATLFPRITSFLLFFPHYLVFPPHPSSFPTLSSLLVPTCYLVSSPPLFTIAKAK